MPSQKAILQITFIFSNKLTNVAHRVGGFIWLTRWAFKVKEEDKDFPHAIFILKICARVKYIEGKKFNIREIGLCKSPSPTCAQCKSPTRCNTQDSFSLAISSPWPHMTILSTTAKFGLLGNSFQWCLSICFPKTCTVLLSYKLARSRSPFPHDFLQAQNHIASSFFLLGQALSLSLLVSFTNCFQVPDHPILFLCTCSSLSVPLLKCKLQS